MSCAKIGDLRKGNKLVHTPPPPARASIFIPEIHMIKLKVKLKMGHLDLFDWRYTFYECFAISFVRAHLIFRTRINSVIFSACAHMIHDYV